MITYTIVCPKCCAKANGYTKGHKAKGTYREATFEPTVNKIDCPGCGFSKENNESKPLEYELWYKTNFRSHVLWARNEEHLTLLIDWLSGNMNKPESDSYLETLPNWMITNKNKVAGKLKKLRHKVAEKRPN